MSVSMYYDRAGAPMEMAAWAHRMNDWEYKVIAKTATVGVEISTVWLGLDHQFGDGPPLIFETMVFGGPLDQETVRYPTEDDARTGHDQMVMRVRRAVLGSGGSA